MVDELFTDLDVGFTTQDIDVCHRIGTKRDGQGRPRPTIAKFVTLQQKQSIFKNISRLKNSQKWASTYINDDLSPEDQRRQRDIRTLVKHCKAKSHVCKQSGMAMVLDNVWYGPTWESLNQLPTGLRMEDAMVVEVQNGIAFQGQHVYLSNLYPVDIQHEGKVYHSAEALFQSQRAGVCGDPGLAAKLSRMTDSWQVKNEAKGIKSNPQWEEKQLDVMRSVISSKFDQNNAIREKLINLKGDIFYEATKDPYWGCGHFREQRQLINRQSAAGHNYLGALLMEYRDQACAK